MSAQASEQWKNKGNGEYQSKNFNEAVKSYTKAIELSPTPNPALYTNRAAAYAGLFQWEQSLSDALKSTQIKGDWVKGHFRQGIALSELKRYDDAVNAFSKACQFEPANQDLKGYLTQAQELKKKFQPQPKPQSQPQQPQQQQQKQQPQQPQQQQQAPPKPSGPSTPASKLKDEGNEFFKVGNIEKAIVCYSKAIDVSQDPNEKAIILCNRAQCYVQLYDSKKVVEDCSACLNIQPNNLKALMRRGFAYEALEKMQLALEDLRRVMTIDPSIQSVNQAVHRISSGLRAQGVKV